MHREMTIALSACCLTIGMNGCERTPIDGPGERERGRASESDHNRGDKSMHAEHGHQHGANSEDHAHDEVTLGTIMIGDLEVELAQGHGFVEPGKEGHLVVKLPYCDQGQTIVRAWIGTEDRLQSVVSKGEYAASHDDYDVHAVAPAPLPDNVSWWIEIEKPDGAKVVGSVKVHRE